MKKEYTLVSPVQTENSIEKLQADVAPSELLDAPLTARSDNRTSVYNATTETLYVEQKFAGLPFFTCVLQPDHYVLFENYALYYDYTFSYQGNKSFTKTMIKYGSEIVINALP